MKRRTKVKAPPAAPDYYLPGISDDPNGVDVSGFGNQPRPPRYPTLRRKIIDGRILVDLNDLITGLRHQYHTEVAEALALYRDKFKPPGEEA